MKRPIAKIITNTTHEISMINILYHLLPLFTKNIYDQTINDSYFKLSDKFTEKINPIASLVKNQIVGYMYCRNQMIDYLIQPK